MGGTVADSLELHADRICPACHAPLVRKPGERPSEFAERTTCGRECGYRAMRERKRAAQPYHPPCIICDAQVPRKAGEGAGRWIARRTCGAVCRAKQAIRDRGEARVIIDAAIAAHPPCLICGKTVPFYNQDRLDTYKRKVHCSRACAEVTKKRKRDAAKKPRWADKAAVPEAPAETVEQFLANGGRIKVYPPAFCAPSQARPPERDIKRILRRLKLVPEAKIKWGETFRLSQHST